MQNGETINANHILIRNPETKRQLSVILQYQNELK
jgi:hypothetical protein